MTFRMTCWNTVTWNSEECHSTTVCKCASMFVLILCQYMSISRQSILIIVHACTMQNRDFAFTQIYLSVMAYYTCNSYYWYQRDAADVISNLPKTSSVNYEIRCTLRHRSWKHNFKKSYKIMSISRLCSSQFQCITSKVNFGQLYAAVPRTFLIHIHCMCLHKTTCSIKNRITTVITIKLKDIWFKQFLLSKVYWISNEK